MLLFFALCFVGVAIAGSTAFVIFWPLTLVHIRDRHAGTEADFGPGAFLAPAALRWLPPMISPMPGASTSIAATVRPSSLRRM